MKFRFGLRLLVVLFVVVSIVLGLVVIPLARFPAVEAQYRQKPLSFIEFYETPVSEIIADLRGKHGVPIYLDEDCSRGDRLVSICGPGIPVEEGVELLASLAGLTVIIGPDRIVLTDDPDASSRLGYYTPEQVKDPSFANKVMGYWF